MVVLNTWRGPPSSPSSSSSPSSTVALLTSAKAAWCCRNILRRCFAAAVSASANARPSASPGKEAFRRSISASSTSLKQGVRKLTEPPSSKPPYMPPFVYATILWCTASVRQYLSTIVRASVGRLLQDESRPEAGAADGAARRRPRRGSRRGSRRGLRSLDGEHLDVAVRLHFSKALDAHPIPISDLFKEAAQLWSCNQVSLEAFAFVCQAALLGSQRQLLLPVRVGGRDPRRCVTASAINQGQRSNQLCKVGRGGGDANQELTVVEAGEVLPACCGNS